MTVPLFKDQYSPTVFTLIHLKFTDLQSKIRNSHKFELENPPEFLTINEATGEVIFDRDQWMGQKQVKSLKATVKSTATETFARTSLTFNFKKISRKQFCSKELSCFFSNIRFLTTEFDNNKAGNKQVIGETTPELYQKVCEKFERIFLPENGDDFPKKSLMF